MPPINESREAPDRRPRGGGAAFQGGLEIGEVAAAFADLAAGVIVAGPWVAVAGDERAGLQRRHRIQRPRPAGAGLRCRPRQPHVRPVVNDIAGDDQAQAGRRTADPGA